MRRKGLGAAARRGLPGLVALLALTVLMLAAGARAQEVATLALPGEALYPEGIVALENGDLFVTGFGNGSILKVSDGEVESFKEPGEDGLSSAVGLAADETRNRLWVANFSFDGFTSDLKVYDLTSGEPLASLADPDDSPHFFNEIAIADDGRVYVSDTAAPVIWTAAPELQGVEVFVQDDLLMNPDPERAFGLNGLALTPGGDYLIASVMDRIDQGGGRLVRVDLETKEVTDVELSGDAVETFGGSDGMFFYGDSLLMVNVTPPASVVSAAFAEDYSSAELTSHNAFEEVYNRPTSSTVLDGRLWTVNSQLDHIIDDENGALNTPPELPFELVGVPLSKLFGQGAQSPTAKDATAALGGPLETVLTFDATTGANAENVAVVHDGAVYTALSFSGEISVLEPDGRARVIDIDAQTDAPTAVSGLAVARGGGVYFTAFTNPGFYLLNQDASGEDVVTQLAALPEGAVPNGVTADQRGNLYAADSTLGIIWRLRPGAAEAERWADDPLFKPRGTVPGTDLNPGSNGLTFFRNALYVSNPTQATVLRVPIESGGDAGDVEVYAEVRGDDIAFDARGNLWVTNPFATTVSRVDYGTLEVEIVLSADDGLESPTALAFSRPSAPDTDDANHTALYISSATFADAGAIPALQRADVRVSGAPIPLGPSPSVWPQVTP